MHSKVTRGSLRLKDGLVNYLFHPGPSQAHGPPLILFGGTAQTINSMNGHHQALAKLRPVFQYELRGQGTTTTLPLANCGMEQQVADFLNVIDAAQQEDLFSIPINTGFDMSGFSFGGRTVLAIAAEHPHLIRRAVVTGVPKDRSATGRTILRGWMNALDRNDLEGFLWQSLADGHSENFLKKHESRLESYIASAVKQNRCEAIRALVRDTHPPGPSDPWHNLSMATRATQRGFTSDRALFLGGSMDRLSLSEEVKALAEVGDWSCHILTGSGHGVPLELPREWRQHTEEFLNAI